MVWQSWESFVVKRNETAVSADLGDSSEIQMRTLKTYFEENGFPRRVIRWAWRGVKWFFTDRILLFARDHENKDGYHSIQLQRMWQQCGAQCVVLCFPWGLSFSIELCRVLGMTWGREQDAHDAKTFFLKVGKGGVLSETIAYFIGEAPYRIRIRSPRWTASCLTEKVGKGSRQIGSVSSRKGLAVWFFACFSLFQRFQRKVREDYL